MRDSSGLGNNLEVLLEYTGFEFPRSFHLKTLCEFVTGLEKFFFIKGGPVYGSSLPFPSVHTARIGTE